MATTTNLLLNNQDTGANSNTWGIALNLNFSKIDAKLGDMTTVATTSGTETLTESQERVNVIKCTGTLVGNLTLEFSGRGGTWIIWNATSGAFSVTAKVTGQTGVAIPQSSVVSVFCDGTDIRKGSEQSVLLSAGAAQTVTLAASGEVLALESTDAGASQGPNLSLYRNSASPAANDQIGGINWYGKDSGGTKTLLAGIGVTYTDPTDGSEDSIMYFSVMTGSSYVSELALVGTSLYPITNDGLALGLATLSFSDLFLASGGVVNFNNGDVTITHSSNALAFAGASSGYTFDAALSIGISAALTAGTIELGHASANTLSASSGILSIEGVALARVNSTDADSLLDTLGSEGIGSVAYHNGSSWVLVASTTTPTPGNPKILRMRETGVVAWETE